MKIKNVRAKNIGPLENVKIRLPFYPDGKPKPVVLVGKNGSGKSLLLAYIADAFIEFERQFYNDLKVKKDKYFKFVSKSYIKSGKEYGFFEAIFEDSRNNSPEEYFYSEVLSHIKWDDFKEIYTKEKISIKEFNLQDEKFKEYGLFKSCSKGKDLKKALDSNVLLYFPWNRTEIPAWLNKEDLLIGFQRTKKLVGISGRKIINVGNFEELYSWILSVVLDSYVYQNINISQYDLSLRNELNKIIDTILYYKKNDPGERIRFGIGRRDLGSRISVVKAEINSQNKEYNRKEIAPTIFHLSAGESSLLSLFASILMDYDKQQIEKTEFSLEDIEGVVLIDEADLNLHIDLQSKVFPQLMKLFPNIQFIITTHSPFLVSGLQEAFSEDLVIVELPSGNLIDVERFSEFRIALEKFNKMGEDYLKQKEVLEKKLQSLGKPLIITEGKTDWMILEKAKEKLSIDLNIDFYKTDEDLGKDNLIRMCGDFSKIHQSKPLIFIFDRDLEEKEKKKVMDDSKGYKDWGNNVFSFVLPEPSHRKGYKNINIEMFFKDEEIRTEDQNGKRLFFTNEAEKIVNPTTNKFEKYKIAPPNTNDEFSKRILSKDIDKIEDESGRKKALSKTKFAEYIYKDVPPFNSFDFTEFKKIFQIIEKILKECNHA